MVARRRSASTDLSAVASPLCIGVDVSKDWLDIADNAGRAVRIANTVAAITQVLHRSLRWTLAARLPRHGLRSDWRL
jgi:hypothetical protein